MIIVSQVSKMSASKNKNKNRKKIKKKGNIKIIDGNQYQLCECVLCNSTMNQPTQKKKHAERKTFFHGTSSGDFVRESEREQDEKKKLNLTTLKKNQRFLKTETGFKDI